MELVSIRRGDVYGIVNQGKPKEGHGTSVVMSNRMVCCSVNDRRRNRDKTFGCGSQDELANSPISAVKSFSDLGRRVLDEIHMPPREAS